jgi:uncharacterized protein YwgA
MTNTADNAAASAAPGSSSQAREALVTADMIASNVSSANRVAPSLSKISIIEDIYDFADKLRAGSTLSGKHEK